MLAISPRPRRPARDQRDGLAVLITIPLTGWRLMTRGAVPAGAGVITRTPNATTGSGSGNPAVDHAANTRSRYGRPRSGAAEW